MEVLVGFLRGDPDRPVILGAVYNATHATPEPLPQRNTRSAIRTQTSPGGGGFNELAFEDGRGVERVMIHAQKDFEETVNDTHYLNVKNHQKVTVASGQQIEVGGDRLVAVGGKLATLVGGGESTHVRGNRAVDVSGNESHVVAGNALRAVKGVLAESAEGDALSSVGGDHNLVVRGSSITQIGGKDPTSDASFVTYVQGRSFHTASKGALLRAGEGAQIRLECGKSFIEIGPQKITLSAPSIEVLGGDKVRLASKDSHLALDGDSATLQSKSAGISTPDGTKMKVSGKDAMVSAPGSSTTKSPKIDLKSGGDGGASDKDKKDDPSKPPNLTLTFFHGTDAKTIRDTSYRVVIDDLVHEGKTSPAGELKVYAPDTAKVAFVILWANETSPELYPSGPLQWLVHLVPFVDTASTPMGARMRLRNLGYDPGAKLDRKDIDDATRSAILEFQLDWGLPPTGALEEATQKKLAETYGR
jgi:type VI secretion system secreted protein VgrG